MPGPDRVLPSAGPVDFPSVPGQPDEVVLREIRDQTVAALQGLLDRRDITASVGVLGAGSDDLDSGRAYLAKLGPGGFMVPTWPAAHGGMGLDGPAAQVVRGRGPSSPPPTCTPSSSVST